MTNQGREFPLDQGTAFGTWEDSVSLLMYHETAKWLRNYDFTGKDVADYGGANGLCRSMVESATFTTVDIDAEKKPDIVDDILTHDKKYDTVILRFVLHYLSDEAIRTLFKQLIENGTGEVHVIQFWNEDTLSLAEKRRISAVYEEGTNGKKYFRRSSDFKELLQEFPVEYTECVAGVEYVVGSDFYRNRFGIEVVDALYHNETLYHGIIKLKKGE